MKDVYFTLILAALTATAIVTYTVHAVRRGTSRSDRVERVGGSALLGREVVEMGYWAMSPLARGAAALGITPNGLTWLALFFGAGAGVALGFGWFGLGALLALFCVVCDVLDGQVARLTDSSSDSGEVLDASVDRYTEFFYIAGLIVYYRTEAWLVLVALAALAASFMVSYATAKAEALGVPPPRGPMRRHERGAYLITGAGLTSLLAPTIAAHWPSLPPSLPEVVALAVIALAGNYSAVLRLYRTARALRERAS